jgi:hypothetical protein
LELQIEVVNPITSNTEVMEVDGANSRTEELLTCLLELPDCIHVSSYCRREILVLTDVECEIEADIGRYQRQIQERAALLNLP